MSRKPRISGNGGSAQARGDRASGESGRPSRWSVHDGGSLLVAATAFSVVLSTLVSIKFIAPALHTAAVTPFYLASMRAGRYGRALGVGLRWAAALFASVMVVGVFAPDRVAASLPMATDMADTMMRWIGERDTPPADYTQLIWAMALFLVAAVATGGIGGHVVASIAVGSAAYGALFVQRHGFNIIQSALVSVPLWVVAILLAMIVLVIPAGLPMLTRVGVVTDADDRSDLRRFMIAGAVLFAASLLFRLTTAGFWQAVLERWTVI